MFNQSRDGGNNRKDKGKRAIGQPSNLGLDEQSDRVKYQAILSSVRRKQGEHFKGIRSDDFEGEFSNITSNLEVVTPTTRPIISTLRWGPIKNYALEMAIEDMIERQLDDLPDVEDIKEPIENAQRIKMRYNVPCDKEKVFSTENVEDFKAYASGRLSKWKNEEGDGHTGAEGEPPQPWNNGGPSINELLLSFDSHVAHNLWFGLDRGVLTCYSRANQIRAWSLNSPTVINLLHETGLFHLKDCMYKHLNAPLISAFVERWQPETNSFHLPFGEMTVTLHDVWYILRVPMMGKPLIGDNLTIEYVGALKCQLASLLGVDMSEVHKEWNNGTVHFDFIQENLKDSRNFPDFVARGYLLWLLGATLFIDKTGNRCHGHFLPYVVNLEEVNNHAWGATTLAYLYRQLGMASRADTTQISSCLTLLQALQ